MSARWRWRWPLGTNACVPEVTGRRSDCPVAGLLIRKLEVHRELTGGDVEPVRGLAGVPPLVTARHSAASNFGGKCDGPRWYGRRPV